MSSLAERHANSMIEFAQITLRNAGESEGFVTGRTAVPFEPEPVVSICRFPPNAQRVAIRNCRTGDEIVSVTCSEEGKFRLWPQRYEIDGTFPSVVAVMSRTIRDRVCGRY